MTKKKISKLLNNKIFWAVISLIASLFIWVYMTGTQEEVISRDLNGVEVVFTGEDTLQSQRGLVITDVSDLTVDVTISGTRLNIGRLTADDVKAVINVANITSTSVYNVSYTLTFPDSVDASAVTVTNRSPSTVGFQVTRMDSKQVPVEVQFKGSVAEGYLLGDLEYEPTTVTVSGPLTELESIDHVYAEVTIDNLTETRTVDANFDIVDAGGNVLDKDGLEFDVNTISVTIPVSVIKEVPIYVTLIEGAGATRENTIITPDVQTITIAGDASELDGINRIEVGPIDLTEFELTNEYDLSIALPNNVENISGIESVHVTVEITGLEVRSYTVTNISYTGLPEEYQAELVTHSLTVRIRATSEVLDSLSSSNLRAVADLSNTTATGTMDTSNVEIRVDGFTNAGAVGTYRLTFNVTRA